MANTNDNIDVLYKALDKAGYDDIGTPDEFRQYVSDSKNVETLHKALGNAGYDDIGSLDEFSSWLSPAPAEEPAAPVGQSKPAGNGMVSSVVQDDGYQQPTDALGNPITNNGQPYSQEVLKRYYSPDNKAGQFKDLAQIAKEAGREQMGPTDPALAEGAKIGAGMIAQMRQQPQQENPFSAENPSMMQPKGYQPPLPFKEKADEMKQLSKDPNLNKYWAGRQGESERRMVEQSPRGFGYTMEGIQQANEAEGARQMNRNAFDQQNFDKFYESHVAPVFGEERKKGEQRTREAVKDIPRYDVPGAQSGFARMFESSVAEAKYKDPEKIANATLKRVQDDSTEGGFGDYVLSRMGINGNTGDGGDSPQLSEREKEWMQKLFSKETEEVADKIISRIYDTYKQENTPKNVLDYISGKAFHENMAASLYDAMVRRAAGSSGIREQLRAMASEEFGRDQSWMTRVAGGAAPFAVDMLTGAFGIPTLVGQAAVKGGTKLAAKQVLKEMEKRAAAKGLKNAALKEATSGAEAVAERYLATNAPILNLAMRTAGSAANFATYDTQGEIIRQIAEGKFEPVDLMKAAVHGAVLGGAMGAVGGTIANATRSASRATKIGADVAGLGAETGIFGISNGLAKAQADGIDIQDVDWADTMGEAFGQVVGMKTVGGIVHPKEFLKRYQQSKDYDLQLNKHDLDELKAAGYDFDGIFKGLGKFGEIAPERAILKKTQEGVIDQQGNPVKKEEAYVDVDAYKEVMQNPDISSSTKRKICYIATGQVIAPEKTFGVTIDGKSVTTMNAMGNNIETKDFKTEKDAQEYYDEQREQARTNTINGLEYILSRQGMHDAIKTAKNRTTEQTGIDLGDKDQLDNTDGRELNEALDAYIKNLQDVYNERFNEKLIGEETAEAGEEPQTEPTGTGGGGSVPGTGESGTNGGGFGTENVNSGTENVNSGTPERNERRDAAYNRGVAIADDESDLTTIGQDTRLAEARLSQQLPDTDPVLSKLKKGIVEAVASGDLEEADRLIAEAAPRLNAQQMEAVESFRDIAETQEGIRDVIFTKTEEYEQARRQQLEEISDPNGMVTELVLKDGSTVYYKSGDLDNHYGGLYVVTADGETKQIPTREVKASYPATSAEEILENNVNTYADQLQEYYNAVSSGIAYNPGQELDIIMSGQPFHVTFAGNDPMGNPVIQMEDGSQMPMRQEDLQQAVAEADNVRIQQTLQAETESARLAEQQQRFTKDIAGFAEGQPDLTAAATNPKTAAEYISQQFGAGGTDPEKDRKKYITNIQNTKEQLARRQEDAQKELDRLNQWLAGNEDIADEQEVAQVRQQIAYLDASIRDIVARQQQWGEIRRQLMTQDELNAIEQQRRKEVFKVRNGYEPRLPIHEVTTGEDRITLEDGKPNFGLTSVANANNYLLKNYPASDDAEKFINEQRLALRNRQRDEVQPEMNRRNDLLNAYISGHQELSQQEITQLVHEIADFEAMQDALSKQAVRLREIAEGIPSLYERNEREEELSPTEQRAKELDKATSKEDKLSRARNIYKEYPDALDVINDQEPRDLDEFIADNLGLGSMNWEGYDAFGGRHVVGVQEAVFGKRGATRGIGKGYSTNAFNQYLAKTGEGKGFNDIVHAIYEAQPDVDGGKRWSTEDISNGLIHLLLSAQKPSDISHRIIDNRIAEAEDIVRRQEELDREAEEEAKYQELQEWAEAYHLTPDEVETYQDYLTEKPWEFDEEVINQIIADNEQNQRSKALDSQHPDGSVAGQGEGGEEEVRPVSPAEGTAENPPVNGEPRAEGGTGGETLPDNNVSGGAQAPVESEPDRLQVRTRQTESPNPTDSESQSFPARLAEAKAETDTNPTEAQKKAGNYKMGHISFGGYDYSIENPKGSERSGIDANGKPWSIEMKNTYGYILRKIGVDGDHLDMFINDDADLDAFDGRVYVVDQKNPDGTFDEHKVMYGFPTWSTARQAYEQNYEPGWWDSRVMQMTGVKKADFDRWLTDSDHKTKPFADYFRIKNSETVNDPTEQLMADVADREEAARLAEANLDERERIRKSLAEEETTGDNAVQHLSDAYKLGDKEIIRDIADRVRTIVRGDEEIMMDDSLDPDWLEEYDGADPDLLAQKLIVRMSRHYYLDYDNDIPYIVTGIESPKDRPLIPESIRYDVEDMLVADREVTNGKGVPSMRKLSDAARVIMPKLEKLTDEKLKNALEALKDFPDSTPVSAIELEMERRSNVKDAVDQVMQEVEKRKQDNVMPTPASIGEDEMQYMDDEQLIQRRHKAKNDLHTSSTILATTNIKKGSKKEAQLFQNIMQAEADINAINEELERRANFDQYDYQIEDGTLAGEPQPAVRERSTKAVIKVIGDAGVPIKQVSQQEADDMMQLYTAMNRQAITDYARSMRPDDAKRFAVINVRDPYAVPKYFEKKQYADEYRVWGNRMGGNFQTLDLDKGQMKGEELKQAADIMPQIDVWHGSGAVFTKFDHSHMGEGAGSQVFGYGTYLSDSRTIGEDYSKITSKGWKYKEKTADQLYKEARNADLEEGRYYTNGEIVAMILSRINAGYSPEVSIERARADAISAIHDHEEHLSELSPSELKDLEGFKRELEFVNSLKPEDFEESKKNLYKVDIPDDTGDNYLDWYQTIKKPLRRRIADAVRVLEGQPKQSVWYANYNNGWESLANMIERNQWAYMEIHDRLLQAFGGKLADEKKVSDLMSKAGFVGVKYPAGTIMGGGNGATNYVIFNEDNAKIVDRIQFMFDDGSTPKIYGWTDGTGIFLTPLGMNPNSPMHEYTHIWDKYIQKHDPKLWKEMVKTFKQTAMWQQIRENENYRSIWNDDDRMASEVHSRLTGARSQEEFNKAAADQNNKDAESIINQVKDVLRRFWEKIASLFGYGKDRLEEFVLMPLKDVLEGFNPITGDNTMDPRAMVKAMAEEARNKKGVKSLMREGDLFTDADFLPEKKPAKGKKEISDMSDEALLKAASNKDGKERREYLNEYDSRHEDELTEERDSYYDMLDSSNTTKDQALDMYNNVYRQFVKDGYATADRTKLMAQTEALESYIGWLDEQEAEKEMEKEEQEQSQADQKFEQEKKEVRQVGYDLTRLRLRPLEEGEECHVERRYVENGSFNFTGTEKIESMDDVAYIFKKLEDAAIENSFLVLEKDGVPTIVHLGVGNYAAVIAEAQPALAAYSELNPDKVYFIHNHPSGSLKSSKPDREVMTTMRAIFGKKLQDGIIIDTTSGKYGIFNEQSTFAQEGNMPKSRQGELPVKVYSFSKQVFDEGWNPETAFAGDSSYKIAEFVSSHRLGEHKKMSLIIMNQNWNVTGNVFLPYTSLGQAARREGADLIARYMNQMGGTMVVLYGSYDYNDAIDRQDIDYLRTMLKVRKVYLRDVIHIDHSAYDMGIVSEPAVAREEAEDNAKVVDMKPQKQIEELYTEGMKPEDVIDMQERVKDMSPRELIEQYKRLNSQMLDENGLDIDEQEEAFRKKWFSEHDGIEGFGQALADHTKMQIEKYTWNKMALRWDILERIKDLGLENYLEGDKLPNEDVAKIVKMYRHSSPAILGVNNKFNEELNQLSDRSILDLGNPSVNMLAAGIENKPMRLKGTKLLGKIRKHGYEAKDVKNLPLATHNPIAIFKGSQPDSFAILTELNIKGKNVLVTLSSGEGNDIDFNIISSTYPKDFEKVLYWINGDKGLYYDKEKALDYLRHSAPIAETTKSKALDSVAKVVKDFKNPKLSEENLRNIYAKWVTAADETADMLGGVKVIFEAEAPEEGTLGWYDPNDNSVHVVLPAHTDVGEVKRTVCHEKLGHEGLVALLGDQNEANKFGQFIFDSASKDLRQRIMQKADDEDPAWKDPKRFSHAAQEVLADIAADGPRTADEFSLWRKVKHYLIRLLNKLGLRIRGLLNDHDMRYYVLKTGEALKRWNQMTDPEKRAAARQETDFDLMRSRRGKPRKRNNESMAQYLQRLRDWERWKIAEEQAAANNDPMPEADKINDKWHEKYNADIAEWKRQNNIEDGAEGLGEFPKREQNESPQEYAARVADYETQKDAWRNAPSLFDYLQRANEEYKTAYREWKERYGIREAENVDLGLYEGDPDRLPHIVDPEDLEADTRVEADLVEAVGIDMSSDGAKSHTKLSLIERRKNLESANAEDAIWLHNLVKQINEEAKRQGVKPEELREAMADIIEGTYFEEVLKDEDGNVISIEDISDTVPIKKTPGLQAIMDDIKDWYDYFYHEIEDAGLRNDAGYIEEGYVNHVWSKEKTNPEIWKKYVENFQRTKSPNMRERLFETYRDGRDAGLVPKFKDIADILAYYSSSNNQAIANKKFLDDLSFIVVEEKNSDGEVVSVLPLLNSNKPNIAVSDRYRMYQVPGVGDVYVLKDIQRTFANVFGTMRTQDVPEWLTKVGKAYDVSSSTAKKIELSFSAFHMGALTEVAMAQMRPDRAARALAQYIIWDCAKAGTIPAYAHPEDFKLAASHLVQLGATQDYSAADVNNVTEKLREIVRQLAKDENLAKKGAGLAVTPVAAALDYINKGMDKVLWNYLHDGLKIACFKMFAGQIEKRVEKEGLSAEQREQLLDEAGQYVNDTFGGQYWELLNVSPALIKWLRRGFLSPDWLISTQRHFLANFGFGSLYSESGFLNYLRYNADNIKRAFGADIPKDENRRFRSKNAKQCYLLGVCGFFYVMMNALNTMFRAQDEEKEKEKADEIRRDNPDYKSPYELAYPDGMKWYDYTMYGNTIGQQTHLFLGRYDDGTEWYARWGKQFREFPELFMGRHGVEFPTPLLERMSGKANPIGRYLMYDLPLTVGMYGYKQPRETQEIAEKYGNTVALLAMTAKKFLPFSVPTQQDKEFKMFDLVMPSQKGFTRWKAVDYFKTYIQGGDMDGVMRTYNAAVMNGIDAEDCLKAAIATVKATQRKEQDGGIVDLQSAMNAYDEAQSTAEKKRLRQKIFAYLAEQDYKSFTRNEAIQQVEGFWNGEQPTDNDINKYVKLATSADVRDEYRLEKVRKEAKKFTDEVKTADGDRQKRLRDHYNAWFEIDGIIKDANKQINKLKKQLGKDGNDDTETMNEIRRIRTEAQKDIDAVKAP